MTDRYPHLDLDVSASAELVDRLRRLEDGKTKPSRTSRLLFSDYRNTLNLELKNKR